jgi:hypothetical protein
MKFEEFKVLFIQQLEIATENAEKDLDRQIPRDYEVLLYAPRYSGVIVDVNKAVSALFIEDTRFYRIIDIAILQISNKKSRVFARVSGDDPVPFESTWNTPQGSGPFKHIIAQIKEIDS